MAKEAFYDDSIGAFYFANGGKEQDRAAAASFMYRLDNIFRARQFLGLGFKSFSESFADGTVGVGVLVGDALGEWVDRHDGKVDAVNSRFPAVHAAFERTAKEHGYKVVDL